MVSQLTGEGLRHSMYNEIRIWGGRGLIMLLVSKHRDSKSYDYEVYVNLGLRYD